MANTKIPVELSSTPGIVDNSNATAITIDSSENVGIGTSSPANKLEVSGNVLIGTDSGDAFNADAMLRLQRAGDRVFQQFKVDADQEASILFGDVDDDVECGITYEAANQNLIFKTGNNAEAMRIMSYGTVCINATGPSISTSTALSVLGSGTQESVAIECRKTSATTSSSQRFIRFFANNGSTSMGGIVGNGASNVQFAAISDERLKENIQPLSGSLNKVLALNPISYNWKDSGEYIEAGFVAQEVEQVLPEYVTTDEDEDQTKGLTGGMTAGYISVLTKAIQEQQTLIESLEARITALES